MTIANIQKIEYLLDFIRFRICIFVSFLAIISYLLFNPIGMNLILVFLASFFGCAGVYSYNNITDKKEDLINRGRINPFVYDNTGSLIITSCFFLGALFLLVLPAICTFFYLTSTIMGLIYSSFRIKRYFLVKNLYTGFGITQVFLLGAAKLNSDVILYYFLFSVLLFVGSLISDLRDYRGDRSVGIATLPVVFGYNTAMLVVYFLLILFSVLIIGLNLYNLVILLPFIVFMVFFLRKNKPGVAHSCGGLSITSLTIWLIIMGFL